ncbi:MULTISPECIES: hypothetical protein [unclassified Curtobacterium]|uniref:hypothetical protein n=1 Tax=unclassified Curtobacterium TaxID=257496 RepID=UPI001AE2FB75|nr:MULTISPECIES: hypothetical protein [unclassified Curtobacterium]MBP1302265.1 cobalamin biosynthesis Mg chelatase CobN [Curtobacterium sp. 1310]MDB6425601.1 hypothetical protein [Curtobacterium sp. 20TX0008]MDT0211184.1 hypothetical protein [Curtobacterium sp. BRD11]
MASDPQQRAAAQRAAAQRAAAQPTAAQRAAAQRAAAQRSAVQRSGAARPTAPQRAAAPGTTRPTASAGSRSGDTGDFERLMQRNTVDARALERSARRRRNPIVGKIALGLAVVSAAVDASAFAVFMGGDTTFAFGICFVVVFLTLIAAVLGFIAAVGSFGRWYGAIGVVLAFFANPVILIVLLVVLVPEALSGT